MRGDRSITGCRPFPFISPQRRKGRTTNAVDPSTTSLLPWRAIYARKKTDFTPPMELVKHRETMPHAFLPHCKSLAIRFLKDRGSIAAMRNSMIAIAARELGPRFYWRGLSQVSWLTSTIHQSRYLWAKSRRACPAFSVFRDRRLKI